MNAMLVTFVWALFEATCVVAYVANAGMLPR